MGRADYAEQAVIGCIMLDETAIDIVRVTISPEDFFTRNAEIIYRAMIRLRDDGAAINLATVIAVIGDDAGFASNRGIEYLTRSMEIVGSAQGIAHFSEIVRSESIHRKTLRFSEEIKAIDWSAVKSPESEIARLCDRLAEIYDGSGARPWQEFSDALDDTLVEMNTDQPVSRVKTGFSEVDAKLQLKPGSLTIIAARPAVGKSAFGINILSHIGLDLGLPCAFFSLEMTNTEIVYRILSARSGVNGNSIRLKRMDESEWNRILDAAQRFRNAPIQLDETPGIEISELRSRLRIMARQKNIQCVIVDYLQLMHADNRRITTREQEVSTISRGLKLIAKELRIPVIALSQLNRQLETRADKHPVLSDLRESGSIEQDADNILFLHREREEGKDKEADVDIAKQRNGPTGRVRLAWYGETTRFCDINDKWF